MQYSVTKESNFNHKVLYTYSIISRFMQVSVHLSTKRMMP